MHKMIRYSIAAMVAMFFSLSAAQAQDFEPYIGVGLGAFNLDAGAGSGYTFGGFGFLGVDFNENIAAEVRGGATGNATVLGVDHTIDWFVSYLGKFKLPVNDELQLYGVVGGTTLKTKLSVGGASVTNTSTDFSFGGGAEFKLQDQLHIGAEWVMYAMDANLASPTFPGLDAWGISGTLRYSF